MPEVSAGESGSSGDSNVQTNQRVGRMQVIIVVVMATLCVSVGETMLRAGMKSVGAGNYAGAGFVLAAISNPMVLLGTVLMTVYFALYSLALSWADISFVLPITALSYLFVAFLAHHFLHENVTP